MSPAAAYGLYAVLAAGAAGLYLCLPSTQPGAQRLRVAGTMVGSAAVVLLAGYMTSWLAPGVIPRWLVVMLAAVAIAAAARVITHPRPVYSALYFVVVVLAVAVLCVLAAAQFLGIALVIIYAGAILVTYVFVIMLAQQAGAAPYDRSAREPLACVVLGFLLTAAVTQAVVAPGPWLSLPVAASQARPVEPMRGGAAAETGPLEQLDTPMGNVRGVGAVLSTTYVVALEVAGVLLLVAMVGAIAIAQKRIEPPALTPNERAQLESHEDLHRYGREAAPF